MATVLSNHTLREMGERRITRSYIDRVLSNPAIVQADPVQPTLTRSYAKIVEFGGRTLRVVHRPDGMNTFIVTAHWDRKVKL